MSELKIITIEKNSTNQYYKKNPQKIVFLV